MSKFKVCFSQCYVFEVEAEDEDVAFDLALDDFHSEMRRPIVRTCYDECEIEEIEEDE